MDCPKCGAGFDVTLKESLAPYSMGLKLCPNENRMISAEATARMIFALSRALKAAGNELDHKTDVYLTDAVVNDDMSIHLTLSAIPIIRDAENAKVSDV
jgi:hypothetical protein